MTFTLVSSINCINFFMFFSKLSLCSVVLFLKTLIFVYVFLMSYYNGSCEAVIFVCFFPVSNSLRTGTVFATLISLSFNDFGVECRLIFSNNTRSTVEWSKMEKTMIWSAILYLIWVLVCLSILWLHLWSISRQRWQNSCTRFSQNSVLEWLRTSLWHSCLYREIYITNNM